MTQLEARRTMGVGNSASLKEIELAFQEKTKKLQRQMVPGIPAPDRHRAYEELTRLNKAHQTLRTRPARRPRPRKPIPRKKTLPRRAAAGPYRKPQTLAEAWEQVIDMMPFSRPVSILILITLFALGIFSILINLQ